MKRSKHNLSHYNLLTCNLGELIPCGLAEVLPGDTFQHAAGALIRTQPLVAPVMHPVVARLHHWFMPSRLLWTGWEDFITGNDDTPLDTATATGTGSQTLLDYLGIDPAFAGEVNSLPIAMYNTIFNECYRDQDLTTEVGRESGTIQRIAWEKDYFTSARPWQYKDDAVSIEVTLSGLAPVKGIGTSTQTFGETGITVYETGESGSTSFADATGFWGTGNVYLEEDANNAGFPGVFADLSETQSGVGVDVESFRQAFALQRYAEARSRYGSRYTEYLAYLGVRASDARLQRPEYLGGAKQTISFSEVLATAEGTNTEVGDMAGHGIAAIRTRKYRRFFEEHGYVMTLLSLRPKSMYSNSTNRLWWRSTKEDFWQKELENLSYQEIQNRELYGSAAAPTDTFGWQQRYREYREIPSTVHGEMRSALNYWNLSREFSSDPALNDTFIKCNPSNRIFADQTSDQLIVMVNHHLAARRLVSKKAMI